MTSSPLAPRTLKGALVAYQLPDLFPTVVVFQYNPEQITRSLAPRQAQGGGRGEALRTDGPPEESIQAAVEIDAADQLEQPGGNAVTATLGLHPVLAALERLVRPSFAVVASNTVLSLLGGAMIQAETVPLALFVWGPARVLPVRVTSLSVTEQAFDPRLNPIRLRADIAMKVLTYRDLEVTNPAYWVYMTGFAQKEVMAALNLGLDQGLPALGTTLPI